ncbi:two pore domain potassium channel family protein [Oculatella sp. LEGE 06141]|uniref:potassium channel family protein n=1 Tax=Oculatella sp. LEGE 06141 TaxID=1828648 RepID=UPI00187F3BF2|nr:potassium channel family protein [Oculatella sp. LEGE 06141]MBE9182307.1 two pore domain potassium channel family protein [Oculatella sp. LEGE 06141]
MDVLIRVLGFGLVALSLIDIYLTVLHPRLESGWISLFLIRNVWKGARSLSRKLPRGGDQMLSHVGPVLIVCIIAVWFALLLLGFALVVWTGLGTEIQSTQGDTPTDFIAALYYSGFSLATLGTGDLVPQTSFYRLLTILQAVLGFSSFTLTITYVLSVYSAIIRYNTFALSLYHRTAGTADSVEFLVRLAAGGQGDRIPQNVADIARDLINILESQHSYPVLLYFRFSPTYYALPRLLFVSLNSATLIKSVFDPETHRSIAHSAAVAELWGGSMQLLLELVGVLSLEPQQTAAEHEQSLWRDRYMQAVAPLKHEGITPVLDLESGADRYVALRQSWAPSLLQLTDYMAYRWSDIAPEER